MLPFVSDTDTEVIVQLIELFVKKDWKLKKRSVKHFNLLKGSYAIALLDEQNTDTHFCCKK